MTMIDSAAPRHVTDASSKVGAPADVDDDVMSRADKKQTLPSNDRLIA